MRTRPHSKGRILLKRSTSWTLIGVISLQMTATLAFGQGYIAASGASPGPSPSIDATQAEQINQAVGALDNAKTAAMVSEAGWGAVTAFCGYNCFNYVTGLMTAQNDIETSIAKAQSQATAANASCQAQLMSEIGDPATSAEASTDTAPIHKANTDFIPLALLQAHVTDAANQAQKDETNGATIKAAQTGAGGPLLKLELMKEPKYRLRQPDEEKPKPSTSIARLTFDWIGSFLIHKSFAGFVSGDVNGPVGPDGAPPATAPAQAPIPAAANTTTSIPSTANPTTTASTGAEQFSIAVNAYADQLKKLSQDGDTLGPLATGCRTALQALNQTAGEITVMAKQYDSTVASVKTNGNYCAMGGAAVAVADLGYSIYQSSNTDASNSYEQQLRSETSSRITGLVGVAATSAYGVYSEIAHTNTLSPASQTAAALGISSCATAGFSLFETASREMDRESLSSAEVNDKQQLNDYNSEPGASPLPASSSLEDEFKRFQLFLASLSIAEKIGKWVSYPLGTCAYAATPSQAGSKASCQTAGSSQADFIACAKASDPRLARAFSNMGGEDRFFSVMEQNMGMNRSSFLDFNHPLSPEQIVGIMTVRAPEYRQGLNLILGDLKTKLAAHRGVRTPRLLANQKEPNPQRSEDGLALLPQDDAQAPPFSLAQSSLGARAPASAPNVIDNEYGDLFERVSLRLQADRNRLNQLDWSTPYNRFSQGHH